MRTYGDVVDDLARALARIAAATSPTANVSTADTAAARDAVLAGLRQTVDALTGGRLKPPQPRLSDLELDPFGAFRSALHHMPRLRPSRGLTDAVADGHLTDEWRVAAAAALELGRYDVDLGSLEEASTWTALRDIADISLTFAAVDEGLAHEPSAAGRLADRRARAALRLSSTAVYAAASRRPADRSAGELREPVPARPIQIRAARDIPVAMRRLSAMIRHRGGSLTMHDFGGVLDPLARGLDDADRILRVASWRVPNSEALLGLAAHAEAARDALVPLARHRGQLMTIGLQSHELIGQAADIRGAMRSLLNHIGTPQGAEGLGPARVASVFVFEVVTITGELRSAMRAAADDRQLLVIRHGIDITRRDWVPAQPDDHRVAALIHDLLHASDVVRTPVGVSLSAKQALSLAGPSARLQRHAATNVSPATSRRLGAVPTAHVSG